MSAPTFRKVSACRYEYMGTGYHVERMADGMWDAFLPSEHGYRLWQSCAYVTRRAAARAIADERRHIAQLVKHACGGAK